MDERSVDKLGRKETQSVTDAAMAPALVLALADIAYNIIGFKRKLCFVRGLVWIKRTAL